jgi:putative flippase GtrA
MVKNYFSSQFLVFLITGGIAASVNFGSRILYDIYLDFSFAIVLAYLTGMVTAFVLAKKFVFTKSNHKLHKSVMFFSLVNLVAVVQTWLISMGLAYYLFPYFGLVDYVFELSHAVGIVVPVFTSYLGHKYFSFK